MAYSSITYTSNSSANGGKDYTYSFGAVSHNTDNIKVSIGGTTLTSSQYSVVQGTITLDTAPGGGSAPFDAALSSTNILKVSRFTNRTTAEVVFSANSIIQDEDLNTSGDQGRYLALEAVDRANESIAIDESDSTQYDAQIDGADKRIYGVATPVNENDAVPKSYADSVIGTNLGNWATSTAYVVRDIVKDASNNNIYICNTAHSSTGSTPVSTNTDVAKWTLIVDAATATTSATASASSATTSTAQAALSSDHRADAGKYAVTAEDSTFSLTATNGGTSGLYSAKHYQAKALANQTAAASSATAATASEVAARNSAASVANSYDSFDDLYLGTMSDAISFTASSSTGLLITSNAHGLVDTQIIRVTNSGGALPGNLSASTDYYVRDRTANNFRLATSSGGTAITYSSAGSGTNTWYYADFITPTSSTWSKDSSTISVASNVGVRVGQVVSGSGIPTSPKPNVLSITGSGPYSVVISGNMAAASVDAGSGGAAVTFANRGVYGEFNTTKDGPALNNDGDALATGALYFNTTDNGMKVYDGAAFIAASSAGTTSLVIHKFTASGSETSVASASFSPALSYTANSIIVFLNGVRLEGGAVDYTASNGTTITGLSALAASDELVVCAFKSFTVADTVSAASGGTFNGDVSMGTDNKLLQKGAFMQSSTHQALFLGA